MKKRFTEEQIVKRKCNEMNLLVFIQAKAETKRQS